MFYILKNKQPVQVPDFESYMDWHDKLAALEPNHHPGVSVQIVKSFLHDTIEVSTIFLGTAYGSPVNYQFFETMCFRGIFDQRQWRYSHYRSAEIHHLRIARRLQEEFMKIQLLEDIELSKNVIELQRRGASLWEQYLLCFQNYKKDHPDESSDPRTVYYRTDIDSPEAAK